MEVLEMPPLKRTLQQRQMLFDDLYECAFPLVARFVSKMGGSFEDAKDVFQDALIVLHEKYEDPQFIVTIAEEAYVLGIAKHLWIRKFNKGRHHISLDDTEAAISIPDDFYPSVNSNRLLQLLEHSGEKCMNLLRAFYHEKLPLKQITKMLGYSNEHSASVQKYKCIEKIRTTLKQHTLSYEDFID